MLSLDYKNVIPYLNEEDINTQLVNSTEVYNKIIGSKIDGSDDLGWLHVDHCAPQELIKKVEDKAEEIRQNADVFVLIGVGGSNQGARAVIKAMQKGKSPQILYAGNNLSPRYIRDIIEQLKGKSVYVNIIAKNFATLEPGIHFRIIRKYMEDTYGEQEVGKRIIATGSLNNSLLERLGKQKGYTLMPFPLDIGGRYSVLSAVGLLPIAVAGIDIRELLAGAREMEKHIFSRKPEANIAMQYAVIRNMLLSKGFTIEIISYFEPLLHYFSKWWVQLFGESEGKKRRGIFPTSCSFSEDLHSLGQYIQEGQRIVFETFLHLEDQGCSFPIHAENGDIDGFAYLDNKDFAELNKKAYEATVKAHYHGGVPCIILNIPKLTPYYLGQLFYFFEFACFASGEILGVNPFDQPGVEAYKTNMFKALGKI